MALNIGDLFYTLEARSKGVKETQAQLRNFNSTIGKSDEEVKKFNKTAELRSLNTLKKKFRDGKISADQFFGSMTKGQRQMFMFEEATKKVKSALDRGTISQTQYNNTMKRARIQFLGGASGVRNLDTKMNQPYT